MSVIGGWSLAAERPGPSADDDAECRRGRAASLLLDPSATKSGDRFDRADRGARGHYFIRPSLTVELDAQYVDYSEGFLRGPRCYDHSFVRALVHETLHFWQALSQGFITNLAMQEGELIRIFRETGAVVGHAGLTRAFGETPEGAPFSVLKLSEALCRYWDIHILGPTRLLRERGDQPVPTRDPSRPYTNVSFDRLMTLEDDWAAPYRWALENWGSTASILLFPLVGHFAMQSPRPVDVFIAAADDLRRQASQMGGDIHHNWRLLYAVVKATCERACAELTGFSLAPGWTVIGNTALAQSPVWRPYLHRLSAMRTPEYGGRLEEAFALPGDPGNRNLLLSNFRPALTLFRDGRWFGAPPSTAGSGDGGPRTASRPGLDRDALAIADLAESVRADYLSMLQADFLQGLASASGPRAQH